MTTKYPIQAVFLEKFWVRHEPYTIRQTDDSQTPYLTTMDSLPDQNRGPGEVALIVVLTVISTIIVMLRVCSKLFVLRGMGWDDAMMVVAVVRITSTMRFLNVLIWRPRYFQSFTRPRISSISSMVMVDIIVSWTITSWLIVPNGVSCLAFSTIWLYSLSNSLSFCFYSG